MYGADWEQPDANGVTPLMKAAALNRTFYAQKLIELGVKVDAKDPRGRDAAFYAQMYENFELADMLEEQKCK